MSDQKEDSAAAPQEAIRPYITASSVHVAGGQWVALVTFLTAAQRGPTEITDVPVVGVALPWPLAKALHKILGDVLRQYEAIEGEIAMPASFAKPTPSEAPAGE